MALDPRIILGAQSPDILGAMERGNALAQQTNQARQQQAQNAFLRDNSQALLSGDQNALAQYAQFDPTGAFNMQTQNRNNARADEQLAFERQRLGVQDQRADEEWQMKTAEYARGLSAEQAAAEAQQIEDAVKMGLSAQTPEQWDAMMAQQAPDLVGQFENRDALANRYMDVAAILKGQNPAPLSSAGKTQADINAGLLPEGTPLQNAQGVTVQSSVVLDDGSTVMVMKNGERRVLSPTGDEVEGQAAADAIRQAREYTVENQREIYSGRREGTLGADIELGGEAQGVQDIASATVEAGMSAWEDYGKLQSSLGNIDEAISALDDGAESGIVYNMLPNVTEASASLNNAMNRMGLDVIGSVTFGALSEGEMRLAMETAVPRNLGPTELRSWLERKRVAQEKAATMLADAAQYLTVPGNTINGWIEKNKAAQRPTQEQPAQQEQPARRRWTPDGGLQ